MKIPQSLRKLYDEQYEINIKLKERVDSKLEALIDKRWHYESRLKMPESFALKFESGRIANQKTIEDFFACNVVVENKSSLNKAEKLIKRQFNLEKRRPPSDKFTHKDSSSFPFDDLRLYVTWRDDPMLPPTEIKDILFEVQIKTFLQHAWSIATHDLIYKSDNVSWAKERIAYQIKAMLEHAEISIQEAEKLTTSQALNKTNKHTKNLLKIIQLLNELWVDKSSLPKNLTVLAENVKSAIEAIDINIDKLKTVLDEETKSGRGIKTLNLSPYGIIIQSLFNKEKEKIVKSLSKGTGKFKILIPEEIVIPEGVEKSSLINAIFVS